MKKTSLISLLIFSIVFGATFTSCEDMLTPDSERHSHEVGQDTLYSYWGVLKSLQNVAERYVVLGECRGELVSGTAYLSDSIRAILNFDREAAVDGSNRFLRATDYYHVINSCNSYLEQCDRERVTGTLQPYMLKEAAQVEAIRAWVYLQLVQVYGEVPFYTKALLSTDAINDFLSQPETVNATNLVDKLADGLKAAQLIEMQYGQPNYRSYSYEAATNDKFDGSKGMIPLNLILGDLYLTKGDVASCKLAAEYYYNYLSGNQGQSLVVRGGALPDKYYSYGFKAEGMDKTSYEYVGGGGGSSSSAPWAENDAVSPNAESITAIPSTTNKLWGTVLRGVNELYGYSSEISVQTDTSSATSASVLLIPRYDVKQLAASEAYFNLCKEQTFEIYVGATSGNTFSLADFTLTPDPEVGDARQYWVQDIRQTYSNGLTNTEKFITKQNPNGRFSVAFPMIYRKAMVWLRYAEALNRAGFPSYAFAILKNGLCNNDNWYPQPTPTGSTYDYAVKDSSWVFTTADGSMQVDKPTQAELDAYLATLVDEATLTDDDITAGSKSWTPVSFENYTNDNCSKALYYLDRQEVENAPNYLNFNIEALNGNVNSPVVIHRTSLTSRMISMTSAGGGGDGSNAVTMGIHARGCGLVQTSDKSSSYDYVKQIQKKAQENYKVTLTKEQIYDGSSKDIVQNCIEDLIVDEEALELAFEGCRFFDLMRVAKRRGDTDYLASRISRRDPSLRSKLLDERNWYFKLPE